MIKVYEVTLEWNGWGVTATGPRGGKRLLMTYEFKIHAETACDRLNELAEFEQR